MTVDMFKWVMTESIRNLMTHPFVAFLFHYSELAMAGCFVPAMFEHRSSTTWLIWRNPHSLNLCEKFPLAPCNLKGKPESVGEVPIGCKRSYRWPNIPVGYDAMWLQKQICIGYEWGHPPEWHPRWLSVWRPHWLQMQECTSLTSLLVAARHVAEGKRVMMKSLEYSKLNCWCSTGSGGYTGMWQPNIWPNVGL